MTEILPELIKVGGLAGALLLVVLYFFHKYITAQDIRNAEREEKDKITNAKREEKDKEISFEREKKLLEMLHNSLNTVRDLISKVEVIRSEQNRLGGFTKKEHEEMLALIKGTQQSVGQILGELKRKEG